MMNNNQHSERYDFKIGEVVTIGGNPNVLGEVIDVSDTVQIAVRILTPPQQGKTVYTTRFTYYTKPMPNLTAKEIREKFSAVKKRDIKLQTTVLKDTPINEEVPSDDVPTEKEIDLSVEENVPTVSIDVVKEEVNNVFSDKKEIVQIEEVVVVEALEEDFTQLSLF